MSYISLLPVGTWAKAAYLDFPKLIASDKTSLFPFNVLHAGRGCLKCKRSRCATTFTTIACYTRCNSASNKKGNEKDDLFF